MSNIDEMEAGVNLDILVAEQVLGQTVPEGLAYSLGEGWGVHRDGVANSWWFERHWPKRYSTDIGAAWEVVEALRKRWLMVDVNSGDHLATKEQWYVEISDAELVSHGPGGTGIAQTIDLKVWAMTAPLAICRAALKAIAASR